MYYQNLCINCNGNLPRWTLFAENEMLKTNKSVVCMVTVVIQKSSRFQFGVVVVIVVQISPFRSLSLFVIFTLYIYSRSGRCSIRIQCEQNRIKNIYQNEPVISFHSWRIYMYIDDSIVSRRRRCDGDGKDICARESLVRRTTSEQQENEARNKQLNERMENNRFREKMQGRTTTTTITRFFTGLLQLLLTLSLLPLN